MCAIGYAARLSIFFIAIISAAACLMFLVIALRTSTEITAVAKQRSPKRPFMDRLRQPDPGFSDFLSMLTHVVPWSIGFFWLGVFALRIMAEALIGGESVVTSGMDALLAVTVKALIPAIIVAYVVLWCLRGYVAVRLRRDRNGFGDGGLARDRQSRDAVPLAPNNSIQADAQKDARG
jgi:hypothetical protein